MRQRLLGIQQLRRAVEKSPNPNKSIFRRMLLVDSGLSQRLGLRCGQLGVGRFRDGHDKRRAITVYPAKEVSRRYSLGLDRHHVLVKFELHPCFQLEQLQSLEFRRRNPYAKSQVQIRSDRRQKTYYVSFQRYRLIRLGEPVCLRSARKASKRWTQLPEGRVRPV